TCDRLLRQEPTLAPVYFRRGRIHANQFAFYEASADHLAAMALAAGNPIGWRTFAQGANQDGQTYAGKGDWDQACQAFTNAARWERQEARHLVGLAWAQLEARRRDDFRATCRRLFDDYR